jgi:hypothetical protein
MPGLLEPRPAPRGHLPALVGTAVVVVAAPVFVAGHWSLEAWGIAAGLWGVGQALMLFLGQLPLGMGSLAASGTVAFGRMLRAVGAMVVLIVLTVADAHLGLPAAVVYALAYTAEFGTSMLTYFGREAGT